ncbi:MAG: RnfABCDGE type electron transport complex subunit C, partial [Spirochaetes bacterium]|nr:RnfABCDGE type electron transport complex subunit C [Candidatus Ornithospirochaeta stercoravium]
MNRLATFRRGGVHPDDKKALSKDKKLEKLPLPKEIVVSMSQHLGAPATLVKKKGDEVKRGEVIGEESGYISASVHSPVDGIIKDIKKVRVSSGAVADAAVIECSPEQSDCFTEKHDWKNLSPEEIVKLIREMGIVGMGGATFPTAVKVTIPMGKEVDALVINGVECEPYLTSDYRLMMEKPDEVLEGVMVAAKAVNPKRIIIGIEANKMDAVSVISSRIAADNLPIEVMPLKTKYPQGDEKQLLKATIGKEVPSGKLPLDVRAVVCNLGTCFALYEAAVFHKPLIERVITVSGEGINEPKNLIAPIGTKFSDLIAYCGGE